MKIRHFGIGLCFLIAVAFCNGQESYELIEIEGKKSLKAAIPQGELRDYLVGNPEKIKNILQVYVGENPTNDQVSLLGKYKIQNQAIIFTPLFGFQNGISYTWKWMIDNKRFTFKIPPDENYTPTELVGIYPSLDTLPANQLKIYLYFSAPMSEGKVYKYIYIINSSGDTLHQPFLKLEPELWDAKHQRLTLWFDPGRVKRDLGPNEYHGTPLIESEKYHIIVSDEWQDAKGYPLKYKVIKPFYVTKDDRTKPDIKTWIINSPQIQSIEPFEIIFPEAMDFALMHNSIDILDRNDEFVKGEIEVMNQDRKWLFLPHHAWREGTYRIRIRGELEDMAGNNLNRLFDRDLYDETEEVNDNVYYWLKFETKAAQN